MLPDINLDELPEPLRSAVADLMRRRDADPRASFSRTESMTFFGHGLSKQLELEASSALVTYTDGASAASTKAALTTGRSGS
jgi:hypothetical protein